MSGWIGVDLDGTLAHFDRWRGPDSIGLPIPAMVKRVKTWLAEGKEVRIFTARASDPRLIPPIERWLKLHGLPALKITNVKDFQMLELWDDRAVQVIHNTGRAVHASPLQSSNRPELIDIAAPADDAPTPPFSVERTFEPNAAEVEAFKQAVKSRARYTSNILLDALDSGDDFTPTDPEADHQHTDTDMPATALLRPLESTAPNNSAPARDELVLPFPQSTDALNRHEEERDPVILSPPPSAHEEHEVLLNATEARRNIAAAAKWYPSLTVENDDWDPSPLSLRDEGR